MLKRLLIIVTALFSFSLSAIEVEEWKWGFDGTVVENHINPLSVMVSNPMPVPFDGVVQLQRQDQMGARVGAPIIKKVFLSPYASKWIQFYPYVKNSFEEWSLVWGRKPNQRAPIKVPVKGGKAIVYLASGPSVLSRTRIKLPYFQENLFPPSVGATTGLIGVVIDKQPEFTPLQREAFSDWLHAGGKVHIIEGSNGNFPDLSSDYSFLNFSGDKKQVGSGEVIKHKGTKIINQAILGAPGKIPLAERRIYVQEMGNSFFRKLRGQLKTNHNWVLIFLISIVYGILVTVVNFIVGRKARKAWKPIAFFAGTVIVFSLLLAWCGKRGYGERSQILSLTYARELDKNHFALTQWMDIFVTDGAYYKITHKASTNIYADCQSMNPINAEIYNGKNGFFLVDIPLFSSMQLFHKSDARTAEPVGITGKSRINGSDLEFLNITLSEDFPQPILEAKAVVHDKIYTLYKNRRWNEFTIRGGSGKNVSEYIRSWNNSGRYYGFYSQEKPDEEVFKSTIAPLIIRSRGGDKIIEAYYPTACAMDNKIDIYIMAKTPEEFKSDRQMINKESGYTLFHFTLP